LSKNLVLGHFSYLHSVHILLKKFGEKIFKTQNFTAVFVKVTIFRNMAKILFLQFSFFFHFKIFSNSDAKSKFFDSFSIHYNVYTYKKYFLKSFLVKIAKFWQFLLKFCLKSDFFFNFAKNGTFSKTIIEK
jgi:hypothetical protein